MLINSGSRATAGSNNLSGKDRMAWDSGIRLFELIDFKHNKERYKKTFFGGYAVRVAEDTAFSGNTPKYREKWLTGLDACIEYKETGERGLLTAYLPDDRWYHNRVTLMDNPQYYINGLLTRDFGDISRAEVMVQIQCLRDIVKEEQPIFKVLTPSNKEIDFFYTEREAVDFTNKKEIKLMGVQAIPREVQPYITCHIEKGKRWEYKQDVKALIDRYHGLEYGWTSCEKFMQEYVPMIVDLIKERTVAFKGIDANSNKSNLHAAVMDVLSTLSSDQIDSLRRQAEERRTATAIPQPAPQQELPATSELPEGQEHGEAMLSDDNSLTRTKLARMSKEDLVKIAEGRGIPTDGLKRPDILEAILVTQDQPEEQEQTILN